MFGRYDDDDDDDDDESMLYRAGGGMVVVRFMSSIESVDGDVDSNDFVPSSMSSLAIDPRAGAYVDDGGMRWRDDGGGGASNDDGTMNSSFVT